MEQLVHGSLEDGWRRSHIKGKAIKAIQPQMGINRHQLLRLLISAAGMPVSSPVC